MVVVVVAGIRAVLVPVAGRELNIGDGDASVLVLSLIHISEPTRPY